MAEDHHYVPRFYLKGFTENKKLWVYEQRQKPRESKPKDEAHRPDFYSLDADETGKRDNAAEKQLARIESLAAPIVRKLITPQYVLTPEKASDLVVFVAFTFVRTPVWREQLDRVAVKVKREHDSKLAQDKERFYETLREVDTEKIMTEVDYEKLRQMFLGGEYEVRQKSAGFNLWAMFTSGLQVVKELAEFRYQAHYAPPGKEFIASDNPVYTVGPDTEGSMVVGTGFGWPNVRVYFPLNKRACFYMRRGIQPRAVLATPQFVEQVNYLTMLTATRYLYACKYLRRTMRLFDQNGCKVKIGENAFMTEPRPPDWKQR